jgi:hypothetical protein
MSTTLMELARGLQSVGLPVRVIVNHGTVLIPSALGEDEQPIVMDLHEEGRLLRIMRRRYLDLKSGPCREELLVHLMHANLAGKLMKFGIDAPTGEVCAVATVPVMDDKLRGDVVLRTLSLFVEYLPMERPLLQRLLQTGRYAKRLGEMDEGSVQAYPAEIAEADAAGLDAIQADIGSLEAEPQTTLAMVLYGRRCHLAALRDAELKRGEPGLTQTRRAYHEWR